MRKTYNPQFQLGQTPIEDIYINVKSRDDIPQLLLGLQHIYTQRESFDQILGILQRNINSGVDQKNGRPGMDLWKILVLGVLRLNLNWDYDRLHEMANNHKTIRKMLGHGVVDADYEYKLQTLKDNVHLLTPELLDEINQVVIREGHNLVKKKDEDLKGRCDSFVVETNVHYPTDANLLFDAIRKVIKLTAVLCSVFGISGWRQNKKHVRNVKALFTIVRKIRRSNSKNSEKKDQRDDQIKEANQAYIEGVEVCLRKVQETLTSIKGGGFAALEAVAEIKMYICHVERQIDQIRRRVINGENIPHNEKVFSIFEEHTEWISKGKAGVPVELGLKVCVLEDQFGFILHHQVMQNQTDDKITVSMVKEAQSRFPKLRICSFDKGFYTPTNQIELRKILDFVVLPKKGKLSVVEKAHEHSEEFIRLRHQHSAVESGINALEVHGLDRCLDRGLKGFKRYVALAVLGRNLQKLGAVVQQRERKALELKLAA
nr:ISNCY family transposase [Desulfobulbaceae bacterium]